MDLGVARIRETRAALVGPPDRRGVGAARVGGEIEDVAVAPGREHDRIGGEALDLPRHEIAGDDALGLAADEDEIEHLALGVQLHRTGADRAGELRVGAEQELLAGLTAGVECARHLGAAEGAIGQQATVFPGEGHAGRGALVNDVDRNLGEPVDVGFARAVVAALDRIVEQPVDAVAVVLVVLRGVDAALRGDRVGPARAVVKHEALHLVAEIGEGRRARCTGEAGAHDDHLVFPLVGGVDELDVGLVLAPLIGERTGGNLGIERGHRRGAQRGLGGLTFKG